jgi:hypothetical protein
MTHFNVSTQKRAVEVLKGEYIAFYVQYFQFEREQEREWKAAAGAAGEGQEDSSAEAKAPPGKKRKVEKAAAKEKQGCEKVSCGVIYKASSRDLASILGNGSSSSDEEDKNNPELTEEELVEQDKSNAMNEFQKVLKKWLRHDVPWKTLYPDQVETDTPDLVKDLMKLDMGVVYKQIIQEDKDRKCFGFLPLMASCSKGQIGALNAESYAERMNSMGKLVLTDGNSLLKDSEIEMLVTLRMNREFMEFMREHYGDQIKEKQPFGMTIVRASKDPNECD